MRYGARCMLLHGTGDRSAIDPLTGAECPFVKARSCVGAVLVARNVPPDPAAASGELQSAGSADTSVESDIAGPALVVGTDLGEVVADRKDNRPMDGRSTGRMLEAEPPDYRELDTLMEQQR